MRSQEKNCSTAEELGAAAQPEDRSFERFAARSIWVKQTCAATAMSHTEIRRFSIGAFAAAQQIHKADHQSVLISTDFNLPICWGRFRRPGRRVFQPVDTEQDAKSELSKTNLHLQQWECGRFNCAARDKSRPHHQVEVSLVVKLRTRLFRSG